MPKWAFLALFVVTFLIMVIQLSYGFQILGARRNIFGANRHNLKFGIASHLGYALVALFLSLYFLFLYFGSGYERTAFLAVLFSLLLVLVLEATVKRS